MSEVSDATEGRIACPACSEQILEEARKCKHCGEEVGNKTRSVGLMLGLGILFFPLIFGWLTLRRGYGAAARTLTFGWMLFPFVLITLISSGGSQSPKTKVAVSKKKTPATKEKSASLWAKAYYVDEFGDRTKESFVSNSKPILGTFSNSATTDSLLKVDFLIDSPKKINFMLYEYGRKTPVKAYRRTKYNVYIKGDDGKKHSLVAFNSSDRLALGPKSSKKLYSLLSREDKVNFVVAEADNNITSYKFSVNGAGFLKVVSDRGMASD